MLFNIIAVAVILLCVGINIMILLQKKKSAGMSGSISGMGASGDTYWDKNKGRSLEGALEKYTKIAGAAFMIACIVLNIITAISNAR